MGDSKLIILNGASGSGKTFAMERMPEISCNIVPLKKYTTRAPRSHESFVSSVDLVFNTRVDVVKNYKYHYEYYGENYGIDSEDIDNVISKNKNPIVIVRDYEVIIRLMKDYRNPVVIYVHSAYTGEELQKVLREMGREDIDANVRRKREIENFAQYIKYLPDDIFSHHVINYYDDTFVVQMRHYLSKYLEV